MAEAQGDEDREATESTESTEATVHPSKELRTAGQRGADEEATGADRGTATPPPIRDDANKSANKTGIEETGDSPAREERPARARIVRRRAPPLIDPPPRPRR